MPHRDGGSFHSVVPIGFAVKRLAQCYRVILTRPFWNGSARMVSDFGDAPWTSAYSLGVSLRESAQYG